MRREGARGVAVALVSTVLVFTALAVAVVKSPGWSTVRGSFFSWHYLHSDFGGIAHAFLLNVRIFCIAEPIILALALLIAVTRALPGPVFFPLRVLAIAYADVFRGMPTIVVIYLFGFGVPALQLKHVPSSTTFWAIVSLVLVYTAYVSEVYRAGIESVHPSQDAAARSLGLRRGQALRYVVVPQAVRRVIPPLLNDFIGLQKDTALVGIIGAVDAFQAAQIDQAAQFSFAPAIDAAVLFVAITIPLTRFVDWLIVRERRRRQAGTAVVA